MWRWNLTEVIKELEGHLEDLQIGKTISTGDVVEAPGKDHNLGCFGDWYHHHGDQWQNSGPFSLHLFLYVCVCRHETVSHHQNWTCMHGWVCWPVTMIGRWVWWVFLTQHTCKTSRRAAPFRVRGFLLSVMGCDYSLWYILWQQTARAPAGLRWPLRRLWSSCASPLDCRPDVGKINELN